MDYINQQQQQQQHNSKDVEIVQPPDDAISCMKFSPASVPQTYLIASSWANDIRCWEIQSNGQSIAKAMQKHDAPILSCCWSDDGSKVFTASCDKTAKMWDLQSNTFVQIAAHDQPIRTIHYIQRPSYTCVMTGSWDRTGKKIIFIYKNKIFMFCYLS